MITRLVRAYVLRFPVARGKGAVLRHIVPLLPKRGREFEFTAGGGTVVVGWDEVVGRHILREGTFEPAELAAALTCVRPGDNVIDVGANIGLLTVPLARAVTPDGMVVAVEPLPGNVGRLRANLARNGLDAVHIVEAAAGRADGRATLHTAGDPAFGSLREIVKYRTSGDLDVALRSLDSLWCELGRLPISLVKIDVEGAELDVLAGARELLATEHPVLLIEANPGAPAETVRAELDAGGYVEATPPGFGRENHLFRPRYAPRSSALT
jgi:FkbM family methyltransferase